MDKTIGRITSLLNKIEQENCLCLFSTEELLNEFRSTIFSPCENLDYEILFINTLRRIVEVYIKNIISSSFVCENVSKFMLYFFDDGIWHETVIYFKRNEDKFLVFGISKFLAATFYTFPMHLFYSRLTILIRDLCQNTYGRSCLYDLELLSSLVEFDCSKYFNNSICACKNKVSCTISSSEDIFNSLCLELSQSWEALLDIFLRKQNQDICVFLNLWKHLCDRKLNEDLLSIFINGKVAVEFLSLSCKMPPESFKLYVSIISQIFSSNFNGGIWKQLEKNKSEEAVIKALSAEFFLLLSSKNETSSFCNSQCRNPNLLDEENFKFDITSRKIIFIVLNLLAEFRNILLLCEALQKVFDFFAKHVRNWRPQTTYLWIIDTFIEEDDLLFGVMIASLRIYCNLKNSTMGTVNNNIAAGAFMKEMDPHKIFIKFLQQLGIDHNELLSFLLSDETCCLLYLLQYLKLLRTEWKPFIDAHSILNDDESIFSSKDNSPVQFTIHGSNKLVTYSSSSSSDDECVDTVMKKNSTCDYKSTEKLALRTVSVLINLKVAIQKLVDMNEFPYNISPLINLLNICEKESHSIR